MPIRRLPEAVVNRIAAGEVVERPAAAVKELVENAIDAGARRIEVVVRDGGRTLIQVADDGCGLARDDLVLALERHATSKLQGDDLSRISTLGFRGEALPSIAAVSRLTLASRPPSSDTGWAIDVAAGSPTEPRPVALAAGTRVDVRDLFFATPARLKFLKSPATETSHVVRAVSRLAMVDPTISYVVADGPRPLLKLPASRSRSLDDRLLRVASIMGPAFADNAVSIRAERAGIVLEGFAGLPTFSRRQPDMQFLIVNNRPVRDKALMGAIRVAYRDVLQIDRHPVVAIFLSIPGEDVDVNVHPMKTEVRFRDASLIRGLVVAALRQAIEGAGPRVATTAARAFPRRNVGLDDPMANDVGRGAARQPSFARPWPLAGLEEPACGYGMPTNPGRGPSGAAPASAAPLAPEYPLGVARAQIHAAFIVAETRDGVVIVDQHAAHERIMQERLKRQLTKGNVPGQGLLIPAVVSLDEREAERLCRHMDDLKRLGLVIEPFGPGTVVVRETPAPLGTVDAEALVRDLAQDLINLDDALALDQRLDAALASLACHGSVRAGRVLSVAEMNALLREMEQTPRAGQCSHGRPTHVALRLADIERLFDRR